MMVDKNNTLPKPKREPSEKIVLTKVTKDLTDEELDKQINTALDEIFGPEDDSNEEESK